MIRVFEQYGYKSVVAFYRDENISDALFHELEQGGWDRVRYVLKHPNCPLWLRDKYAKSPVWYERYVAYFASKAPAGYWRNAITDADKRIQRIVNHCVEHGYAQGADRIAS